MAAVVTKHRCDKDVPAAVDAYDFGSASVSYIHYIPNAAFPSCLAVLENGGLQLFRLEPKIEKVQEWSPENAAQLEVIKSVVGVPPLGQSQAVDYVILFLRTVDASAGGPKKGAKSSVTSVYKLALNARLGLINPLGTKPLQFGDAAQSSGHVVSVSANLEADACAVLYSNGALVLHSLPSAASTQTHSDTRLLVQIPIAEMPKTPSQIAVAFYNPGYVFLATYSPAQQSVVGCVFNVSFGCLHSQTAAPLQSEELLADRQFVAAFDKTALAINLTFVAAAGQTKKGKQNPATDLEPMSFPVPTGRVKLLDVLSTSQPQLGSHSTAVSVCPLQQVLEGWGETSLAISSSAQVVNQLFESTACKDHASGTAPVTTTPSSFSLSRKPSSGSRIEGQSSPTALTIAKITQKWDQFLVSVQDRSSHAVDLKTIQDVIRTATASHRWDLVDAILTADTTLTLNEAEFEGLLPAMIASYRDDDNKSDASMHPRAPLDLFIHYFSPPRGLKWISAKSIAQALEFALGMDLTPQSDPEIDELMAYLLDCLIASAAEADEPITPHLIGLDPDRTLALLKVLEARMRGWLSQPVKKASKKAVSVKASERLTLDHLLVVACAVIDSHTVDLVTMSREAHAVLLRLCSLVHSYVAFCSSVCKLDGYLQALAPAVSAGGRKREDKGRRALRSSGRKEAIDSMDLTPGRLRLPTTSWEKPTYSHINVRVKK